MARPSNTYKKTKNKPKTKSKSTRKKRAKKKWTLDPDRKAKWLSALGLLVSLFGIYLLLAFVSYLFTWQTDQDQVMEFAWDYFRNKDVAADNLLGKFGATWSHQFFYYGLGLASFLIPVMLLLSGINLFFRKHIFPLKRFSLYLFFGLLILPLALSFFMKSNPFPYGGAFGDASYDYLSGLLGRLGTALLLLFLLLMAMIFVFNMDLSKYLKKKPKAAVDEKDFISMDQATNTGELADLQTESPLEVNTYENVAADLDIDSAVLINKEENVSLEAKEPEPATIVETELVLPPVVEPEMDDLTLDIAEVGEEKIASHFTVDTPYDHTLENANYKYPNLELLDDHGSNNVQIDREELERNKDQIVQTLQNYKIEISKIKATVGPTVTLYEIVPAPGVRISKIKNLEDDIALSLAALGIRIIAPIPGRGTVGIEVPNRHKNIVAMKSMLASEKFVNAKADLPIAIGKTISNENYIADLAKMPHLLIAGATGQGKSVGINAILVSLLYKKHPSELKFVLIDPKKVELSIYNNIEKHYLAKLPGEEEAIITDTKKVINTLNALCIEMDDRYNLLKEAHCRNLKEYNKKFASRKLNPEKGHKFLPYIVLVIDEFADLIMTAGKEVESPIARLAQLARAIGIHLIIATQRPSVNIITGIIKANFPARIAFRVMSKIDSRTILDMGGADQLIGRGDLILSIGSDSVRLQCPFVDTHEVDAVIEHIQSQEGGSGAFILPEFDVDNKDMDFSMDEADEYFLQAAKLVVSTQKGSTSMLQRKFQLGYNRAGRVMDQLEMAGIVGPARGSKPREVFCTDESELEQYLLK